MAASRWLPLPVRTAANSLDSMVEDGSVNQPGDDSIRPMDDLPTAMLGGMLAGPAMRAGSAVAPAVESLLADETGALKPSVPWNRYAKAMQGQNPLDLTAQELGKHVSSLGPSTRVKTGELMGAQAIDQYGTADPTKIIQAHMAEHGLPAPKVIYEPGSIQGGSFNRGTGDIRLGQMTPAELRAYQDPEALRAGTALHEALHASSNVTNPTLGSYPENLTSPESPKSNAELGWDGFMQPHKLEAMLRYAKSDPGSNVKLPSYIDHALDQGMSPKMVSQAWLQNPDQVSKWMGQNIREAVGNRGFKGTDPFLADILQSTGHLPPYRGEMEIPVHRLGRLQAKAGGDIGENWLEQFPDLKRLQDEYKSPVRPGPNASLAEESPSPWKAMAAGAAGTGGVYAAKKWLDSNKPLGQEDAQAKEDDVDQMIQELTERHRNSYKPGW